MDNNEVLSHLMKIEADAFALVTDAQTEADRRLHEAEKQNHIVYEERYSKENQRLETEFLALKENTQRQYQAELDAYREKISSVPVNTDRFAALLNRLVMEET